MRWYLHKYSGEYQESNASWCRLGSFDDEPATNTFRYMSFGGAI